jgi:hypothetical protein
MTRLSLLLFVLPTLVLPACESCEFTFGPRDDSVDLTLTVAGEIADDARASAIVDAAHVEVCRIDHDDRTCEESPLAELLDAPLSNGQEARIDLGGLYDGGSYAHGVKCYYPGLVVIVTSPGCTDATLDLPRVNAEHAGTPGPQTITLAC